MPTAAELLHQAVALPEGSARSLLMLHARHADLRERITACTACSLHESVSAPVPFEGFRSPVAIVGEAPGATEDRMGRPFVGRAGKLLDKVLDSIGWSRSDVVLINSICCRPPHNNYEMAIQADAPFRCRPFLEEQLEASGAWVLVPVGNRAMGAVLPGYEAGISQMRGQAKWRDNYLIVPTFHPAYVLRNPKAQPQMASDFQLVRRIIMGEASAPVPKSYDPTKLIYTMREDNFTEDERRRFATHFKKHGWVQAYSHWVEDKVLLLRDETVTPPSHVDGVVYTVQELVQLSHMNRTWQDVRRLHWAKKEFEAKII